MHRRVSDRSGVVRAEVRAWYQQERPSLLEGTGERWRLWAERYGFSHIAHYASVLSTVRGLSLPDSARAVDIGATPGHLTRLLSREGIDVEAVDIDPSRVRDVFANGRIPTHSIDVETDVLPFADMSVDLVIFCEILEHLRGNPMHALREVARVLRPEGHVIVSIPNVTPVMRWRFLFGEDFMGDPVAEFAKLDDVGHMGHIRLYSEDEAVRILEHCGLRVDARRRAGKLVGDRRYDARLVRRVAPSTMFSHLYLLARPRISAAECS